MTRHAFTAAAVLALVAGGAVAAEKTVEMQDAEGNSAGTVTLTDTASGLLIEAELTGLEPGWHGFHVHQTGACTPDFGVAGDHYAPAGLGHGFKTGDKAHAGDLPNIYADEAGEAHVQIMAAGLALDEGEAPLLDEDGSAIMVHAKPDSYEAEAGAGDRVACGPVTAD